MHEGTTVYNFLRTVRLPKCNPRWKPERSSILGLSKGTDLEVHHQSKISKSSTFHKLTIELQAYVKAAWPGGIASGSMASSLEGIQALYTAEEAL